MKPYIFLSQNFLKDIVNGNNEIINGVDINISTLPYTLTIYFTDRYGNAVNRVIDTLIFQNTNINNMTVSALVGGTYTNIFSLTGNTQSTVITKNESTTTTSSLQITIPETNNPATVVGKLGIYGFLCNLCALTDSEYKKDANYGSYRVIDGSYIHYADYNKWVAKIKMENLPQAQFNLLTNQVDEIGEMTVIPYQDLEASGVYECAVNREYSWGLDRKTSLFNLNMEFNEL